MDFNQPSCNPLKSPISVSDLIATGIKFEVNHDNENDVFKDANEEDYGFNADDENLQLDEAQLVSPWSRPFNELKEHMTEIEEGIFKRIVVHGNMEKGKMPENSRARIRYNSYWEQEGAPFDSSFLRGTTYGFYTGKSSVIEGLEKAVRTMYEGEQSQFVISYKLLFGEMGCPPRVKKCADGLYVIDLVSFNAVGDLDALNDMAEKDRTNYALAVKNIKEIHLKGLDFFQQRLYKNAAHAFEKAVDALNQCILNDEVDEKDHTLFLIKLYTNLAVVYNKLEKPKSACLMCQAIGRLTNNEPPCKATFQEGRALIQLGEFSKARKLLIRAQRMEPNNQEINKELNLLEILSKKSRESEKSICRLAFGFEKKINPDDIKEEESNVSPEFTANMQEILEDFQNQRDEIFNIPPNLTKVEIDEIKKLAQRFNMIVSFCEIKHSYSIRKI